MPHTRNSSRGSKPADAITSLTKDHVEAKKLLGELEKARTAGQRGTLFETLRVALLAHAKVEEEIFYPAFHDAARTKEDEKLFFEAAEEHHLAELVIGELEDAAPDSDPFAAKSKVLKDLIEHHADEEESEMFPRAKRLLDREALEDLGARIEARREELKRELSGRKSAARAAARTSRGRPSARAGERANEAIERAARGEDRAERDDVED